MWCAGASGLANQSGYLTGNPEVEMQGILFPSVDDLPPHRFTKLLAGGRVYLPGVGELPAENLNGHGVTTCALDEFSSFVVLETDGWRQIADVASEFRARRCSESQQVRDFCLGGNHGCFLNTDGEAYCWGDDTNLERGTSPTDAHEPNLVDLTVRINARFQQIACNNYSTCALDVDSRGHVLGSQNVGDSNTFRLLATEGDDPDISGFGRIPGPRPTR